MTAFEGGRRVLSGKDRRPVLAFTDEAGPARNRRQQRETIAFIEENLLRESAAPGKENLK